MQNTVMLRLLLVLGLTGLAAYALTPSVIYFGLDEQKSIEVKKDTAAFKKYVPSWAPESHIVPGLDLQGGVHMVLGVDLDKAVSDRARRVSNRLRTDLDDKKIGFTAVDHLADEGKGDRVRVVFKDDAALATFDKDVADLYGDLAEVARSGLTVTWRIHPDWVAKVRTDAVDQTIKTVSNRIDKMHVTEPSITKRGDDQVQVQLPGFANPDEAKALIGRTAQLEFQMCDDENDFLTKVELPSWAKLETSGYQRNNGSFAQDIFADFPEDRLKEMKQFLIGKVPSGYVVKYGRMFARPGEEVRWRTYTLRAEVALTGDDLVNAQVAMGSPEQPQPYVAIEFSPTGKQLFGDLTTKNVGKRMAIVLEDVVDSAPVINEPITGGNASISMGGSRTREEMIKDANQLSLVLKAGALPAPITFREEKTVGASLGQDALAAARSASLVGILFVFGFLILYYRLAGAIACLGLTLNLVFIFAIMSWLGATVTLPGIAGLLLTVGMANDANVLINERIREELKAGKTARSAVEAGYGNAFSAIIDSNVTTAIAGVVLFQYGSGPIQNFATTLLIGVVTTVFTAVFVTRIFFDLFIANDGNAQPTFMGFFETKKPVDFANLGPKVLQAGLALLAITVLLVPTAGLNWGLDFSGGSELQVKFKTDVKQADIDSVLEKQGFAKRNTQRYGAESQNEWLIRVERLTAVSDDDVKRLTEKINAAFPQGAPKVEFSASEGDRVVVTLKAPAIEDAVELQSALIATEATLMKVVEEDAGLRLRRTRTVDGGQENTDDAVLRDEPYQGKVTYVVQLQGVSDKLTKALSTLGELEVRRVDFVDARVAEALRTDGVLALLLALAGILVYIALRFDVFFAPGALIATLHDPLLALLFVFIALRFEFDTPSVAALLTIVGYSVNGVIVIYDRIREQLPAGDLSLDEVKAVINDAVNATFARTIITVMTTLMTTIPVAIFTSGAVRTFAVTLSVGFVIGSISALFIAPALYLFFRRTFYVPTQVQEGEVTREDRERGVV